MKKIILILILIISATDMIAQSNKNVKNIEQVNTEMKSFHKIIFQITTEDSLAQKALIKQLNNILIIAPNSKLEVVCHGPGLNMLVLNKTVVKEKIEQLTKRGVQFIACEFSMNERNVNKNEIVSEAGFVKGGIIEIVSKQEVGWSYIKSGF